MFDGLAARVVREFFNDRFEDGKRRHAWAIVSRVGGPIYASEPFTDVNTQRILGWAILKDHMNAPKPLFDLMIGSGTKEDFYYALVTDNNDKSEMINLGQDDGKARNQFEAMFPNGRQLDWKYRTGLYGNTRQYAWNRRQCKNAEPAGSIYKNENCYILPVKFAQTKHSALLEAKSDIGTLGLDTRTMMEARNKAAKDRYAQMVPHFGKGRYADPHEFKINMFRHRDGYFWSNHEVDRRVYGDWTILSDREWRRYYNAFVKDKPVEDKSDYIIFGSSSDPAIIWSSMDDMKSETARLLIGEALARGRMNFPDSIQSPRMVNELAKTSGFHIFAVTTEGGKPGEHFYTRDRATFNRQVDSIKKDKKYDCAIHFESGKMKPNPRMFKENNQKKGVARYRDLYIQLAAWVQA